MEIDYSIIPVHCRESMRAYIENGQPVGDFLRAVLENDMVRAFNRADDINANSMLQYAKFLYWAPRICWGSREKVDAWIERGGLCGDEHVERKP